MNCATTTRAVPLRLFAVVVALCVLPFASAQNAQPTAPKNTGSTSPDISIEEMNAIYDFGRQLFDDYAPDQIKEQYDFMSRDEWNTLIAQFQKKLETGTLEEIASLEPKARRTLEALRNKPDMADYADWFAERLELIRSAKEAIAPSLPLAREPQQPTHPFAIPLPPLPAQPQPFYRTPPPDDSVPYYFLCLKRVRNRAKPSNADRLAPLLKIIFASENLPTELVWLAEVESSFNPLAKSPVGARGLFQLMPATAKALGLKLTPVDERLYAAKNTRAAAQLLSRLHKRFGSWPLTLAAYNAGEGRIAAALKKTPGAKTYAEIASKLPAETRLYVPQVLATLVVRENVPLEKFIPALKAVPVVALPTPKP